MAIFSDLTNKFQIIDFLPTHRQLLVRSLKNQNRDHNIDIIFKVVSTLLIPATFEGLEISIAETDEVVRGLIEEYGFKITKYYRIYSLINTEEKRYFINGMSFGVFHNKLDILETSLGRYDYGDLGEMIFWYSD